MPLNVVGIEMDFQHFWRCHLELKQHKDFNKMREMLEVKFTYYFYTRFVCTCLTLFGYENEQTRD